MMFEEIIFFIFEQPAGHHMLEGAQNQMAQDVDVRILPDDALFLSFSYDIHYPADRLLEKIVGFRLNETLAHPHLEHQYPSIFGVGLKKIEKVPDEFPDLIKCAGDPLEM